MLVVKSWNTSLARSKIIYYFFCKCKVGHCINSEYWRSQPIIVTNMQIRLHRHSSDIRFFFKTWSWMHCRVKPHDNVKMSLPFGRLFIKSVTDVGYSGDHSYDFWACFRRSPVHLPHWCRSVDSLTLCIQFLLHHLFIKLSLLKCGSITTLHFHCTIERGREGGGWGFWVLGCVVLTCYMYSGVYTLMLSCCLLFPY